MTTTAPEHFKQVASAFDRKALVYDAFGEDHPHLTRMRHKVYDHLVAVQPKNAHLLELNAGTGFDACQLVARGFTVHATDLSAEMHAQTNIKITQLQLADRLTAQQASFTDLSAVKGQFDGVYSNFGGLNCISDLRAVTRQLPRLLKPNGIATFVIMPRFCPWELALLPKDWRVATRRLRRGGITSNVEGVTFTTTYFSVRQTRAAFGKQFEQVKLEGLSIFTPTADNKSFAPRHPRIYRRLCQLDDAICWHWPFNHWGDFFILSMRYEG